jgi:molybdopterin synthase catalytic subunit
LNVKVLYFAGARDLASKSSETLSVPDGSSISVLEGEILRLHPALRTLRKSIRFSLNLDVVTDGAAINEGDEVGVLPPVAGG